MARKLSYLLGSVVTALFFPLLSSSAYGAIVAGFNTTKTTISIPSGGFGSPVSLPIDIAVANTWPDMDVSLLSWELSIFDNDAFLTGVDDRLLDARGSFNQFMLNRGQTAFFSFNINLPVANLNRAGDELFEGNNLEIIFKDFKINAAKKPDLIALNINGSCSPSNCTVTPPESTEAVPEPLTIIGSATALGFGALLKREHSKKQKKS